MPIITKDKIRPGLFWARFDDGGKRPATLNLIKGHSVYGEQLVEAKGQEFRLWDPYRSKLSAAIIRNLEAFAFRKKLSVLYLGASSGTTASHVSDIIGGEGLVYCIEFAPRVVRDLVQVCATRYNMIPILADARHPESYFHIPQLVDIIYQDVAQPNQAEILIKNAQRFLKPGGTAYLAIKARSIDVVEKPSRVFQREKKRLTQSGFTIVDQLALEPYTSDHVFLSMIYGES